MKISVELVTKYVDFDEVDTDDAISVKMTEIFKVDNESGMLRNVAGYASLAPNKATLMDK